MRHLHLIACVVVACGGAQTKPSTEATPTDSPAARCIATADAVRARRPDEPDKVTVKHVLVKWAGAKRAPAAITRSRDEACLRALSARTKLEKGATFAEVVAEFSDEEGAATREGMLGAITRAESPPPFANAAFELHVGDVSYVVETDFGFHVIMRTE
jgi:NIMA-interacting peptidyl-prolyl cis-trans isomerase 1